MELNKLQTTSMQRDITARAMCSLLDTQFDATSQEVENVLIYPAIDKLKHELLAELAWQFDVSGYIVSLDISQKASLVKKALRVHRYAGTAYAVKSALSSLYQNAWIEEWFNFDGAPFTFRAMVNYLGDTENDNMQSMSKKIIEVIYKTKNVRSELLGIRFVLNSVAAVKLGTYHTIATAVTIAPYIADKINQSIVLKTGVKIKFGNTITIKNYT